jgi:hypothetical protein
MSGAAIPISSPQGIWADVKIDITIGSRAEENDPVAALVTITATNSTKTAIELKAPYRLPARKAFTVSAQVSDKEKLRAIAARDEISVYFDDRDRTIEAGGTFTWSLEYSRMSELYLGHILAYDLFIEPQQAFQNVPVIKHSFTLNVSLLTPDDARWRPLQRWYLHQRNSPLSINPEIEHSREQTIFKFGKFDLTDQSFDLRIAAMYGFKNWIARAFELTVAATLVTLLEHGPALLMKLAGVFK